MSARIDEIVAPIIADAVGLARLQAFVGTIPNPSARKQLVMLWWERGVITANEAELMIEHNGIEAA